MAISVILALTMLPAFPALPAFFLPQVPVAGVIGAAVGIVLTVTAIVLILSGRRHRS